MVFELDDASKHANVAFVIDQKAEMDYILRVDGANLAKTFMPSTCMSPSPPGSGDS
jgi:hypothetical protein